MKLFGSQPTVLLVEDEPLIAEEAAHALTEAGITVYHAYNAEDALKLAQETTSISILLTDIDLPGPIDGMELAKQIRGLNPKMRVIYISGAVLPNLETGDEFVEKPYLAQELIDAIRR